MNTFKLMVVLVLVLALSWTVLFSLIEYKVEQAGGLKSIIVETGKVVKEIGEEINEGSL